jgi:phosphoribosylaminoimidazole (AIR) synthetase
MILVVPREECDDVIDRLQALGERAYRIGEIEGKEPEEPSLLLDRLDARQD